MFKRFISFILLIIIVFSFEFNVFANELQGITYEEFKKSQDYGYIGKEISYEEWNKIILLNNQLEQSLENNDKFYKIYDYSNSKTSEIPNLKKGDILITNGTSSFGLTGHSGIAIGEDIILHIAGPNQNPETQNRSQFYTNYIDDWNDWIKIYRPYNSLYGENAANWAEKTYKNSNATYKINEDLYSTDETYCSKIVFQAYKFGANTPNIFNEVYDENIGYYNPYELKKGVILPYSLDDMIKSDYICKVN